MLRKPEVEAEEERLRLEIRDLNDGDRLAFYEKISGRVKDPDTYAVLNWLFVAGLHHFYLGHHLRGAVNLVCFLFGLLLIPVGLLLGGLGWIFVIFGALLILVVSVMEIPALFQSQLIVQDHNNRFLSEALAPFQKKPEKKRARS